MILKSYEELNPLRERNKDKTIVFTSGTFDLTHVAHLIFFERCKKYGNILVVDVGSDLIIKKYKGSKRPIINEKARLRLVDGLKPVDYCVLQESKEDYIGKDILVAPLFPIFEKLKPDIWVVNDDIESIEIKREVAKRFNIKLVVLERSKDFGEVSTTKIIEKIKDL